MEKLKPVIDFLKSLPGIGEVLEPRPKVATIRFSGVIADTLVRKQGISFSRFSKAIDKAFSKSNLKAVALLINSPGGAAAQTSLIANHIRRLAEEKDVPVYAFVEDVAASGGYWLACAADEIYAQEASIIGSIGVISAGFGFEDFIEKHGIHRRLHTSGENKSFLDPFHPVKPEDVKRLKTIQGDIHESFKAWVLERRGEKLNGSEKTLFDGSFWTAGPAIEKGLINGIGDAQGVMHEKYGEVRFIDVTPERKLPFPMSIMGSLATQESFADEFIGALESRAYWSRYGL